MQQNQSTDDTSFTDEFPDAWPHRIALEALSIALAGVSCIRVLCVIHGMKPLIETRFLSSPEHSTVRLAVSAS
jgi:hypothetical protein